MKPSIKVCCASQSCRNYQILHHDSYVPTRWLCSQCEDALEQQMVEELSRRDDRNRCEPELTQPTKDTNTP